MSTPGPCRGKARVGVGAAATIIVAMIAASTGCFLRRATHVESASAANANSSIRVIVREVQAPATKPADNSPCMICHMDFAEEPLTVDHVAAGVGCAFCHGESEAHGGDEWNITPPDVTFGRGEIDPFCEACHPTHTTGEAYQAFVQKWQGKRRPNGRMVGNRSVCTDCHGNHAVLSPDQQAAVMVE